MSNLDYFNFENKNRDFPFYKNNPHIPKTGWIVLFLFVFISFIAMSICNNEIIGGLLFCIIPLVAVLHYLKWDYKAIFQKPQKSEIKLAIILFIGYIVYAMIMGIILESLSLSGSGVVNESQLTVITLISLPGFLMGEELLKFIPFMFFLRLMYKYTGNRKVSVIVSMSIVMIFFALLHLMDMESLVSVLVLQGFGSIFEFYGYIKTKNLIIPYITHLCTDLLLFSIILLVI